MIKENIFEIVMIVSITATTWFAVLKSLGV